MDSMKGNSMKARLEVGARVLRLLDKRRTASGNESLGAELEQYLIDRELRALEQDIFADPGALESQLVRVRPRRRTE